MKKQLLAITLLAATMSLKAQNPYPVIPTDSVQYVNPGKLGATPSQDLPDYINPTFKNPTYRDTVRFDGIVVSNPKTYGLSTNRKAAYIQKEGGGPWSGVLVMCEPSGSGLTLPNLITETKFYENFVRGYKVRVTGKYAAFQNETQMNLIRNNANWSNAVEQLDLNVYQPVYTVLTIDSLMTGNPTAGTWLQKKVDGEKWEGVLVEIRNVRVNTSSVFGGTRFNWSVQDDAGNQLDIRDMSAYFRNDDFEDTIPKVPNNFQPPVIGTGISYIRGIITEYQVGGVNRYGIAPLMPGDVGPCNVCPPRVGPRTRTPLIATAADSVQISANVTGDTVITTATLYYAPSTSGTFTAVPLVQQGTTDTWSAKIPPFAANTVVKYYIRVTDGRNITINVPDTLGSNSVYYVTANGINNIRDIQFATNPANGTTVWNGDSLAGISVHGVVTATRMNNQTIIQDGQGVNSAVFIQNSPATDNWKIGDSVEITAARVTETFNVTTLYNVTATVLKSGAMLPEFESNLPIDSFRLNRIPFARPWEGVLMKWDSVYVAQVNADSAAGSDFGEWSFSKDSTANTGLRVDDLNSSILNLNKTITKGMFFEYVQGPMLFSFSNFKLIPRNLNDVGLCERDTAAPLITLLGNEMDTIEVGSSYTDLGATANDGRDGNLSLYIVKTGTVDGNTLGDYSILYVVSDFCGNLDSASRWIHVKDTPNVGLSNNELLNAEIRIYPNPATNTITISTKEVKTLPLHVTVYDMIGREMLTRTYTTGNLTETINISTLNNGVYFCEVKNAQGSRTIKFMVTGK